MGYNSNELRIQYRSGRNLLLTSLIKVQGRLMQKMETERTCEQGWTSRCKPCEFKGKQYIHGSLLMDGAGLIECRDGEWCEAIDPFLTVLR